MIKGLADLQKMLQKTTELLSPGEYWLTCISATVLTSDYSGTDYLAVTWQTKDGHQFNQNYHFAHRSPWLRKKALHDLTVWMENMGAENVRELEGSMVKGEVRIQTSTDQRFPDRNEVFAILGAKTKHQLIFDAA